MKRQKTEKPTSEQVKKSEFGCRNCLYNGCECVNMQKFNPQWNEKDASCGGYAYYD